MRTSRFAERQIVGVLHDVARGASVLRLTSNLPCTGGVVEERFLQVARLRTVWRMSAFGSARVSRPDVRDASRATIRCVAIAGVIAACLGFPSPRCLAAQQTAPHPGAVGVGFGVDTSARAAPEWGETGWERPIPQIFRRWAAYLGTALAGNPDYSFWSARDRALGPYPDLTAVSAYQGFPATVVAIRPATAGDTSAYLVQTLFASARTGVVRPLALTSVYAVREEGTWKFSNALERLTRDWPRHTIGAITFISSPTMPFNAARAERTVMFADSLADAFGAPRIKHLRYYVTGSAAEENRLLGLEWMVQSGEDREGRALAPDSLLFSGDPRVGEAYLHEVAHIVLAPLFPARANGLVIEGVTTWAGGTLGLPYPQVMRRFSAFITKYPAITLDSVLTNATVDWGRYPAMALLTQMAFEHGGIASVKLLMAAPPGLAGLRSAAERAIGVPWVKITERWRIQLADAESS